MALDFRFKKITFQNFNFNSVVQKKYFWQMFFWFLFVCFLLCFVIFFSYERIRLENFLINSKTDKDNHKEAFKFFKEKVPLLYFSLLDFLFINKLESQLDEEIWSKILSSINLAYTYIFLTLILALITLIFYIIVNLQIFFLYYRDKKYQLSSAYNHEYFIFSNKMYLEVLVNVTIIFSFFNLLSTLSYFVYSFIILFFNFIYLQILKIKKINSVKTNSELNNYYFWRNKNIKLLLLIFLLQNIFNLLKSFFLARFGVDLDLLWKLTFSFSSLVIFIGLYIKKFLNSELFDIKNKINKMLDRVNSSKMFFSLQKKDALQSYLFVNNLPLFIKKQLKSTKLNINQIVFMLDNLYKDISFFQKNISNEDKLKVFFFIIFEKITYYDELIVIKNNLLKLKSFKKEFLKK